MKTVMKKMFSLLLVAVMLIGVMPFQTFADGLVTIEVTLNGTPYASITKDHPTAGGAPLSSWMEEAKASLPENARAHATCNGLIGNSGNPIDADAVVNGWTVHANFTSPYCEICQSYSHNASDGHCSICGWGNGTGHSSTCTHDCTLGYDCSASNHKDGCKYNLCATCGNPKHGTIPCCAECKNCTGGHETTCTSGCTKNGDCTWAYTHNTGCLSQHKCSVCEQFGHLEENCPSTRCDKCDGTVTNHSRNCPTLSNTGKVKVYLNLNYGNAYGYGENIGYVWADKNELLKDVVADLTEPYRDGHYFQHWTTREGTVIDIYNNEDRATADGVMIYAQWVDIIQSDSGTVNVTVNLGYSGLVEYIHNIVSGVEMGNVLEYAGTPVRLNYKFLGWYWDKDCTKKVKSSDKIYEDRNIYAKWEYRDTNNDILLKIYVNGNTHTPVRTVDMYKYTRDDGYISLSEVKEAVKLYYTAKNSDGMYFDGLYNSTEWLKYVENKKTADAVGSIEMDYEPGADTIVYVMVQNVKDRSYSSSSSSSSSSSNYKADSSNPKTGDMIFTPVAVLGASATCLAVLFFLKKKRAY